MKIERDEKMIVDSKNIVSDIVSKYIKEMSSKIDGYIKENNLDEDNSNFIGITITMSCAVNILSNSLSTILKDMKDIDKAIDLISSDMKEHLCKVMGSIEEEITH